MGVLVDKRAIESQINSTIKQNLQYKQTLPAQRKQNLWIRTDQNRALHSTDVTSLKYYRTNKYIT